MIVSDAGSATLLSFEQGLEQVSLAFFTTVGPAGCFAYMVLGIYMTFGRMDAKERLRLDHFLIIPLGLALAGLILSTNHLGKPANSLFVLLGIGRSPLTNEVTASVVFGGLAFVRWILGYAQRPYARVKPVLLSFAVVMAGAQIWFVANAYSIFTVVTWDIWFTQALLAILAAIGGCALSFMTLACAGVKEDAGVMRGLLGAGAFAVLGYAVVQLLQLHALEGVSSGLYAASQMASLQPAVIAASLLLFLLGYAILALARKAGFDHLFRKGLALVLSGSLLVLLGVFIARFGFYAMYLTMGI